MLENFLRAVPPSNDEAKAGRNAALRPLRQEVVAVLAEWFRECPAEPATPAFPSSRGGPLSRDAVERRSPATSEAPKSAAHR